jgi:hypothetical protein
MKRVRHLHFIIACRFSWRQTIVTKTSTHNFRIFQFHYLFNLLFLEDKTPSTVFLISIPLFLSPIILLYFWKTKSIYNATVFLKITINSHKALRLQQHKTKRKNFRSWRQLPASFYQPSDRVTVRVLYTASLSRPMWHLRLQAPPEWEGVLLWCEKESVGPGGTQQ